MITYSFWEREEKNSLPVIFYVKNENVLPSLSIYQNLPGYKRGKSLLVSVTWNLKPKIDPHFYINYVVS